MKTGLGHKNTQILLSPGLRWAVCSEQPSPCSYSPPDCSAHSQCHWIPPSPRAKGVCGEAGRWPGSDRRSALRGGVGQQHQVPITPFLSFSFSPASSPAVLTVITHTPAPRIRLGQDALLDLSFAYVPPTSKAAISLAPGPPPFGLEWRRQHLGKGHLLLAATPGLSGQVPAAREGAVAFAAWDDDEPWGPWTGNGSFWLPAVQPFQEGTYLATVHLPYLQGQVAMELAVQSE